MSLIKTHFLFLFIFILFYLFIFKNLSHLLKKTAHFLPKRYASVFLPCCIRSFHLQHQCLYTSVCIP